MARKAKETLVPLKVAPDDVLLVQNFLRTEISSDFELIEMLSYGIGVHHAGLSDEVRALMEWLAEEGELKSLCATTTIAQGINFPVSSVFLTSNKYPYGKAMKTDSHGKSTSVHDARAFLNQSGDSVWAQARPHASSLSGKEYKQIWKILSGER